MIGVVSLIVAILVYRRWQAQINRRVAFASRWVWNILLDEKTCRVAEQFFLEAAVLWFVFPFLDSLYDPTKRNSPILMQGYILASVFFLFAVILSHAGKEG